VHHLKPLVSHAQGESFRIASRRLLADGRLRARGRVPKAAVCRRPQNVSRGLCV